jgi:SAM-dependent methyltransferase
VDEKMTISEEYFHYLSNRSLKGKIYRNYFLYPLISRSFKKTDCVLDFGCGVGDYLQFRKNTIGVDINKNNIDYCTQNGNNAKYIENNIIPFDNCTFDGVMMDNVLEHIQDPTPSLIEITRVLKNKGTLIIGVPGIKGFDSDDDHKIFYDRRNLSQLVISLGYQELTAVYTPFLFSSRLMSDKIRIYCMYMVFCKL